MKQTVKFGKRVLTLDVPRRRVVGTLAPRVAKAVSDVDASVRNALKRPYQSPPLAELLRGRTSALILTVDHTRPPPQRMIHPVLDLCAVAGVEATVMITTGRHRQMTDAELRRHLGKRILTTCRVVQHDPFDDAAMVTKGKTRRGTVVRVNRAVFEHDLVIGCGIIEPSYLAGWSGGRKLLMPGVAHHASIDNNHFYLTHPDTRIGRLHGNPLSDDAAEFARKLPLHFIVYEVSGPNDEVAAVVAGDPFKAHERACKRSERMYRIKPKQADIVISSPGGWPYDCDLVQGKKAIIPAIDAVKRNGVIVLCAECREGLGAEAAFIDWLRNKTPAEVVRDVLDRKQFNLGAHGANILARPIVQKNANVILLTSLAIARALKGTYVTPITCLDDAWALANLLAGRDSSVLFIEKARRLILQ